MGVLLQLEIKHAGNLFVKSCIFAREGRKNAPNALLYDGEAAALENLSPRRRETALEILRAYLRGE